MKVLLTGVTGYIGQRLLPILLEEGHHVYCVLRDANRFDHTKYPNASITLVEANFLDPNSLQSIPDDIEAAYYLIHSMSASTKNFGNLEAQCANNFRKRIERTSAEQVIYLSGISNDEELSDHLSSRKGVENILESDNYSLTVLRAGIIVGSGSASFEIIRDLVEKLPIMVAPKWLNTRSQPIAIRNVIQFLIGVLHKSITFNKTFDIGGPEVMTYKEMLLQFAKERKLWRKIYTVPVMTPKLSSYWLYFVTSTSYKLAINLVDSMKIEVVCNKNDLAEELGIKLLSYREAIRLAFDKIAQQNVLSSWTDALSMRTIEEGLDHFMDVPQYGCLTDKKVIDVNDEHLALDNIMSIGGKRGWYFANTLWAIRGFMDKMLGGVGLRRGRKNANHLEAGESLDFWRVLFSSRKEKRLLLYAEMKLPGEAWLEFKIKDHKLYQTATFRPQGVWGRMYWYSLLPFHIVIFRGMIKNISTYHHGILSV